MNSLIRLTLELTALTMALTMSGGASAVTCYQCIYTDTAFQVTSTCAGSLSGTRAVGRCSGSMCRTRWAEYSSPSNNHRDHECIEGGGEGDDALLPPPPPLDRCEGKTTNNESYFVYGAQCCFTTGEVVDYGAKYKVTECFCQRDFCNAAVASPVIESSSTGQWSRPTTSSSLINSAFSSANQSTTTTPGYFKYTTPSNGTNSSSSSSSSRWSSTSVVYLTLVDAVFVFWRL